MARKKSASKKPKLFWRVFISLIGAALILIAISQLLLFFFGTQTAASVTMRRQGGANSGAAPNQRYVWSIDYTFTDNNGKSHNGTTSHRGSDTSAGVVDDTVYYFKFAPFLSALESDAEPGPSQPLYIALGVFLIIVMNRKGGKKPPAKECLRTPDQLTDYDDSVEELFHDS